MDNINNLPSIELLGKSPIAREGAFHYRYMPAIQEAIKKKPQSPELLQYARDLFAAAEKHGWKLREDEVFWFKEHLDLVVD